MQYKSTRHYGDCPSANRQKARYVDKEEWLRQKRFNKIKALAQPQLKRQHIQLKSAVFLSIDPSFQPRLLTKIQDIVLARKKISNNSLTLNLDIFHKELLQGFMSKLFDVIIINSPNLIRIDLFGILLSDQSFILIGKYHLKHIESISFDGVPITERAAHIISSYYCQSLKEISFLNADLTNKKMCSLVKSNWPNLSSLAIRSNPSLTYDYFKLLEKCKWPKLTSLSFQIRSYNDKMLNSIFRLATCEIKELKFTQVHRLWVNLNILSKCADRWRGYSTNMKFSECNNLNGIKNISFFYNLL